MRHSPAKPRHDRDHGALLHAAGLKATPVRLGVLHALCETREVLSADQVIESLVRARGSAAKGRSPDRVTVYRTLNALVDAGIAHKVDPGDRVFRFGLSGEHAAHLPAQICGCERSENCGHEAVLPAAMTASDGMHGHPHFLCESCGRVECMEDTEVVLRPKSKGPGSAPKHVRQRHVLLKGTCGECGPE